MSLQTWPPHAWPAKNTARRPLPLPPTFPASCSRNSIVDCQIDTGSKKCIIPPLPRHNSREECISKDLEGLASDGSCRASDCLLTPPPRSSSIHASSLQSTVNDPLASSRSSIASNYLLTPPPRSSSLNACSQGLTKRPNMKLYVQTRPMSQLSTLSTFIPPPPTPTTARRKRMLKLRRHLGTEVPDESTYVEALRRSNLSSISEMPVFRRHSIASESLLIEKDSYSDCVDCQKTVLRMPPPSDSLPSGKTWYREKNGYRWEETDLTAVLNALRSL